MFYPFDHTLVACALSRVISDSLIPSEKLLTRLMMHQLISINEYFNIVTFLPNNCMRILKKKSKHKKEGSRMPSLRNFP